MKRILSLSMVFAVAACASQPRDLEVIERTPQAKDDGSNRPDKRVLYHSRQFDGYEVSPRIVDSFKGKRLILFGETHGTREMPAYFSSAVVAAAKRFQNVYAGVEFPVSLQPVVDKYMASGDVRLLKDTKFFSDPNLHSGRASEAMIAMLDELRKTSNVRVFCFDASSKKEDRDTAMARQVLAMIEKVNSPNGEALVAAAKDIEAMVPVRLRKIGEPLVMVLTGNIHSRLEKGIPGGSENFATMGSEILRLSEDRKLSREPLTADNVVSTLFRYERGTAWNCVSGDNGRVDCGARVTQTPPSIYSTSNETGRYYLKELELIEGHNATVFFREISASQPLH